ncbi:hypothetical protein B0A49_10613 [Cryomyces minteri]|uniref:Uncharacterized protein n=1 Tax=Cryomyces minteri TaxID=331657 RepID=A0A4U0WXI3_9PEZI|nr:hypothetical protein B0A49_09109 [Cryomyces minteri]TKA68038.1 hypothetical protein B0A49_10613 [Cryomyces minteri]
MPQGSSWPFSNPDSQVKGADGVVVSRCCNDQPASETVSDMIKSTYKRDAELRQISIACTTLEITCDRIRGRSYVSLLGSTLPRRIREHTHGPLRLANFRIPALPHQPF